MKAPAFLGFLWLLAACNPVAKKNVQPYELIPHDALMVVQINDPILAQAALDNHPVLQFLTAASAQEGVLIERLLPDNSPALLAFSPLGKNQFARTSVYSAPPNDSLVPQGSLLKTYEGFPIHSLEGTPTVYQTQLGDQLLHSSSQLVVENSIRNFKAGKPGIESQTFLKQITNVNTNNPINIVLHPQAQGFINTLLAEVPLFPKINTNWLGMDLRLEEPLTGDGVAFFADSLADPLRLLKGLERKEIFSDAIVPSTFESFVVYPLDNVQQLQDNLNYYNRQKNNAKPSTNLVDWPTIDEWALVTLKQGTGLLLHRNNTENELVLETESEKTYRGVTYARMQLPDAWSALATVMAQPFEFNWGCRIDDFLLFAENEATLRTLISNAKDGSTLRNNNDYQSLKAQLAEAASFLWVASGQSIQGVHTEIPFPVKSYPYVALQGVGEKNYVHLRLHVQPHQKNQPQNTVVNQHTLALEAPAAIPPQWVKNHRTKGMDVVVQDVQNVLYLFSNTGTLFWKKQLPGKIIGPIEQVDLYKNKRLQLAFRTAERFMILDRNGKVVKPFDVALPQGSSPAPLAVFDYDKNRDYRFLLAQGNSLLMYDNRGRKVRGFGLSKLDSPLQSSPKHFRYANKDYIVLPLQNNTLKIVSRQGKDRIQVKSKIAFGDNPVFDYLDTFTTTDRDGALVQVDTKGNVVRSNLELAPGHRIDATTKSLVSLSQNILTIKGIPVTLPYGTYTPPKIFYINNTIYVSTTDLDTQKVYMYYSNGTAVGGFPIYGAGSADLSNADNDRSVELVVPAEDNTLLLYQLAQ